ncbi:mRNA turnover 4 [Balamuthia mandrillaris]
MPKSRRNKLITLARTEKRVGERKETLVTQIRESVSQFQTIYVFTTQNMRTNYLKEVRSHWAASRFFLGKNKVMQIALGRSAQEEAAENLHLLSKEVTGNCGLLFTNSSRAEVEEFFKNYTKKDFARSGSPATETVHLSMGPLEQFSHSIEPFLRKLGMPTKLQKGVIHLERDYTVCKEGEPLTPEQAKILQLLGMETAEFHIELTHVWHDGKFQSLLE